MGDSLSLMHEDGPFFNQSTKKRKRKMKNKGEKKEEAEATRLNDSTMSGNGPSCFPHNSEVSSGAVNDSNVQLARRRRGKRKKKVVQEAEVTNLNNTNVPAEVLGSVLQELSINTKPNCTFKNNNNEKKQEDEAIEEHKSNDPVGEDSAVQELKEMTDMMNGRLNTEKRKKKKRRRKRKQEALNFNDSPATLEGLGASLQELTVKIKPMAGSNNSVEKQRKNGRKTVIGCEDINTLDKGLNTATEIAEMNVEYTDTCSLNSDVQNGALQGLTTSLEEYQELASSVQAAPADAFIEVSSICLDVKAGFTNCMEDLKTYDQHDNTMKVASMENSSTLDAEAYKNIEEIVSEDVVSETIKVDEPQPILNSLVITRDPRILRKNLLILDLNGLLIDVIPNKHGGQKPDMVLSGKHVFKRPFVDDFLEFCFKRFAVAVWSSRKKKNIDRLVDFLFGNAREKLVFCWNQCQCTQTYFKTRENWNKPLVLKELRKVWEKLGPDLQFDKGEYNESNTLLLDDSPYKAICNPENTAIFPNPYQYNMSQDISLGPGGDIRVYLEGLSLAENIPEYVRQKPFGQRAITRSDPSWRFYGKVFNQVQRRNQKWAQKKRWNRQSRNSVL
ncbi:hypothetical protein SAY86_025018 [Trapa natans]|uniref:FCP1 homology domain-containing protein n=1 Tax=Trapa natans TaxID=22666 RepID=A0AAN7RKC1_TRANT|nr:hypothetical protein SAY86_025018 [Trapa natans]